MGLKVFSEAAKSDRFVGLVAECSVSLKSQAVRFGEDIRSKNADISNDKECIKHSRCKPKVFNVKLNCVEEKFKIYKTVPKNIVKTRFDG